MKPETAAVLSRFSFVVALLALCSMLYWSEYTTPQVTECDVKLEQARAVCRELEAELCRLSPAYCEGEKLCD